MSSLGRHSPALPVLVLLAMAAGSAGAQQQPEPEPGLAAPQQQADPPVQQAQTALRFGLVMAYNRYAEAAMALAGPMTGFVADWRQPWGSARWRAQAQLLAGAPDYSSPVSGNMSKRPTVQSVWRLGYEWPSAQATARGSTLETALEWHTYYNDLRGRTDTGSVGYERERYGLWAGVGYSAPFTAPTALLQRWRLDAALLLYGVNVSRLSQVSASYGDAVNTQRSGAALRGALALRTAAGEFRPYLQARVLDASDTQRVGNLAVTEPANTSWELGVQWLWR